MEGGHQGVGNGVWKNPEVHTGGVHFWFGALRLPCALFSVKALNLFEGSHNSVLVGETPPYSWVHVTQAWASRHQFPSDDSDGLRDEHEAQFCCRAKGTHPRLEIGRASCRERV